MKLIPSQKLGVQVPSEGQLWSWKDMWSPLGGHMYLFPSPQQCCPVMLPVTAGQTHLQAQLGAPGGLGETPLGRSVVRSRDSPESEKPRLRNNMNTETHFLFLQVCK